MNYSSKTLGQMVPGYILDKLGCSTLSEQADDFSSLGIVINKLIQHRATLPGLIKTTREYLSTLDEEFLDKQSGTLNRLFVKKDTIETLGAQIDEQRQLLAGTEKELADSVINIDVLLDDALRQRYSEVIDAFGKLITSEKIWSKTSTDTKEIKPQLFQPDFFHSTFAGLQFCGHDNRNIIIYPTFVLLCDAGGDYQVINLKQLKFAFRPLREVIPLYFLKPSDALVIEYVWAHVNKDGSRSYRHNNYQRPVVQYGVIKLEAGEVSEELHISHFDHAQGFAKAMEALLYQLIAKPGRGYNLPFISAEYLQSLDLFTTDLVAFVRKLQADTSLVKFMSEVKGLEALGKHGPEKTIELLFQLDLIKIFHAVSNLEDVRSKESFALMYVQDRLRGSELITEDTIHLLYTTPFITTYTNLYHAFKGELTGKLEDDNYFKFAFLLNLFNKDLKERHLALLYQFASIVIKADQRVSPREEDVLKRIMKTPAKPPSSEPVPPKVITNDAEQSIDAVLQELQALIGLAAVKQQVSTLVNFIKIQKSRQESGLKTSSLSYHIVFTGNPGTGKTTVARIVSSLYKSLGILSEDKLVETDRSGLVGEYVGHTAIKTNKLVDSAINGVLFIDEAYGLSAGSEQDYGKEAVATLLKRMEDDRDKLVVILAGYDAEMKTFIDMNPGLKSRFNRYVQFADYTAEELLAIFESFCQKTEYVLSPAAREKIAHRFQSVYATRDASFGNGRYVRNQFEKTLEMQANRLAKVTTLNKEMLTTIEAEDIPIENV